MAAGGRRAWAVAGNQLVTVDAAAGAIVHRTSLRAFTPLTMLASGGALWLAGTRPAGPALLRMDVVGRLQRTIPLPAPVTSLAAAGGALWLAHDGQGVRELDPAARPAGRLDGRHRRPRAAGDGTSRPAMGGAPGRRPRQLHPAST